MSDVTSVLIALLKMAYIHSDINTCDCGQVCKSFGQDTELHELVPVQARWQTWKKDCNHCFDGLTGVTRVGPVNALRLLLK